MHNMRYYRREYNECLKEKNYDYIDQEIMKDIWGIKSVCKAYEKYAKDKGLDPLQADEQYGLSISWAHEHLFGNQI